MYTPFIQSKDNPDKHANLEDGLIFIEQTKIHPRFAIWTNNKNNLPIWAYLTVKPQCAEHTASVSERKWKKNESLQRE